jgi:hypothetical protein
MNLDLPLKIRNFWHKYKEISNYIIILYIVLIVMYPYIGLVCLNNRLFSKLLLINKNIWFFCVIFANFKEIKKPIKSSKIFLWVVLNASKREAILKKLFSMKSKNKKKLYLDLFIQYALLAIQIYIKWDLLKVWLYNTALILIPIWYMKSKIFVHVIYVKQKHQDFYHVAMINAIK